MRWGTGFRGLKWEKCVWKDVGGRIKVSGEVNVEVESECEIE